MSATMPTRPSAPPRQTPAVPTPRAPRLRGRDDALEAVGELVAAVAGGAGAVALVVGETGVGKSRMLDEAAVTAARAGLRTLRCDAGACDPETPFAPLLAALVDDGLELPAAAETAAASAAADQRFWLLQELAGRLAAAAEAGPLLVALDDLHRADAGTLWALRALTRQLAGVPVGWLLSCREQAPAAVRELRAALAADGARAIALAPLTDADATAVASELLGAAPSAAERALIDRAEGNPLLLVALLDARDRDAGDGSLPHCQALLRARLDGLSSTAREAVEVAAVLGASFAVEQLAALLDRSPVALLRPLHEAIDAGLLREQEDRIAFRHALVRDLLHASLPAGVRGALHRQAADALLATGAPARAVADHLAAGARAGDRAAAATLRTAARELADSAPRRAAGYALDALRLLGDAAPADAATIDALRLEAVELLTRAGRDAEAAALVEQALASVLPPEREARLRLAQARGLARAGAATAPAALASCERALELDGVSAETRARLLALRARLLSDRGEAAAPAAVAEALAAARAAGCRDAERSALVDAADAALLRRAPGEAAALLDAAVARLLADAPVSAAVALLGDVSPALLAPAPPALPAADADGALSFPSIPAALGGAGAADGEAAADRAVLAELAVAASRRALLTAAQGAVAGPLATAERALRDAREAGDVRAARDWAAARCQLLLDAGRVADARSAAEALLEAAPGAPLAAEALHDAAPGAPLAAEALLEAAPGALLAAEALHAAPGAPLAAPGGLALACAYDRAALVARRVLTLAALAACDRDAAQRAAAPLLGRLDDPAPRIRGAARALAARLAEADGEHGRALALLAPWFDAVRDGAALPAGMEQPADAAWLVRLALRAGDPARAAIAARSADDLHAAALYEEHRAGTAAALPALLETVALRRGGDRPLALASALEDAGRALVLAGRREEAVELLDEALAAAAETGAERDAARVRSRLRALGLRRLAGAKQRPSGGWAALTEAELMVVREVAAGATNRAAAARLFLSPHTVSTHLRHAFAKLGINSRVELARMALEHDREPAAAGALVA